MSPLPLLRFGSKARSTSLGIALCTMFIVASFSIVGGLKVSVDRLEANFSSDFYLVTKPGPSGPSLFDPSEVVAVVPCAYGSYVGVAVNATPSSAMVFSLDDRGGTIFPGLPSVSGSTLLETHGASFPELVTVTSTYTSEDVQIAGRYALEQFGDDWLLGSPALLANLTGQTGMANFAISESLSTGQRESLSSKGYSVQTMTGIIDFLGQSVEQIQDDIVIVLLPSSFVVAVLMYGFIGGETADRRHDIGILKTIGAGRVRILRLLLSNALLISLRGGALGLAIGIVLSYAISTAASSMFTSVFLMSIDPLLLVLAFSSTVAAGLVGALVPSLRMTVSPPVRDLREAVR